MWFKDVSSAGNWKLALTNALIKTFTAECMLWMDRNRWSTRSNESTLIYSLKLHSLKLSNPHNIINTLIMLCIKVVPKITVILILQRKKKSWVGFHKIGEYACTTYAKCVAQCLAKTDFWWKQQVYSNKLCTWIFLSMQITILKVCMGYIVTTRFFKGN